MTKHSKKGETRFDYYRWFSAQEPIFGKTGLGRLAAIRLFVVGSGGLGFNIALGAARCGIETIFQCDPQAAEPDNLNRIIAGPRHVGVAKVRVLEEMLQSFDRAAADRKFSYYPIQKPVEDPAVVPFLDKATHIISCPNSTQSRRYTVKCAVERRIPLFNVGVSCEPRRSLRGEISVYWPGRSDLACPSCISLKSAAKAGRTPLFYPPLIVLSGLALQLLVANATLASNSRCPNYLSYDALRHTLSGYDIAADPTCVDCHSDQARLHLANQGHWLSGQFATAGPKRSKLP